MKDKKQLRSQLLEVKQNVKERLKVLYEEVKKKQKNTMRKEWRLIRRKENIKTKKNFLKDLYKFGKLYSQRQRITN